MNLSKIFLINILFFLPFFLFAQEDIPSISFINGDVSSDASNDVVLDPNRTEFYRSNSNGLTLVQIDNNEFKSYKYVLQVDYSNNLVVNKTLFKGETGIKQWTYEYDEGMLDSECYLKDGILSQQYFYDKQGHKIQEDDYKNNEIIKSTLFTYNREGLVHKESAESKISNTITETVYKYDNLFRIKQIEKTYPDGRVVYWESFLTDKGIITKEYYTLKDEVYTFWYNKFGQETAGEVKSIKEEEESDNSENKEESKKDKNKKQKVKKESIKSKWENYYFASGLREKKVEENFVLNKKVITNYNKDGKEIKIQTFFDDTIDKIDYYDYYDKKNIIYYKIIEDLKKNETFYQYNQQGTCICTKFVENDKIKREINYFDNGNREEIIYTSSKYQIKKLYDKDNNLIKKY